MRLELLGEPRADTSWAQPTLDLAFDEAGLLRVSQAYEQATEWHKLHPSI